MTNLRGLYVEFVSDWSERALYVETVNDLPERTLY